MGDGWMGDGWMDGWMDGCMDGCMDRCVCGWVDARACTRVDISQPTREVVVEEERGEKGREERDQSIAIHPSIHSYPSMYMLHIQTDTHINT